MLNRTPKAVIITLFKNDLITGVPFNNNLNEALLNSTGHNPTCPERTAAGLLTDTDIIWSRGRRHVKPAIPR